SGRWTERSWWCLPEALEGVMLLDLLRLRIPLGHEPEDVLLRRLRRERLQPAHRLGADVSERVHAPDTGPENVTSLRAVLPAIERSLDFTAQDEIGLLERVVVEPDADAGLILDEEQPVMSGARVLVEEPLEEDALEPRAAARAALGRRRDLRR